MWVGGTLGDRGYSGIIFVGEIVPPLSAPRWASAFLLFFFGGFGGVLVELRAFSATNTKIRELFTIFGVNSFVKIFEFFPNWRVEKVM